MKPLNIIAIVITVINVAILVAVKNYEQNYADYICTYTKKDIGLETSIETTQENCEKISAMVLLLWDYKSDKTTANVTIEEQPILEWMPRGYKPKGGRNMQLGSEWLITPN